MATISKSELALELKISKARVSQYVQAGLPVRGDGKLDRAAALNWITRNVVGSLGDRVGANEAARLARGSESERAPANSELKYFKSVIDQLKNPLDQGAVFVGLALPDRIAPAVASLAVGAGASMKVAFTLFLATAIMARQIVHEILAENGIEPFSSDPDAPIWRPVDEQLVAWSVLAKQAGEKVDFDAWLAWSRAHYGDDVRRPNPPDTQ